MKLNVLLFIFLLIFLLDDSIARRSGGGSKGGSSGSKGGSWFGSSSGSKGSSWFSSSSGSKGGSSSNRFGSSFGSSSSSSSSSSSKPSSSSSSSGGWFSSIFGSKRNDPPKPKPVTAAPPPKYRTPPSAPVFDNNYKSKYSPQNNRPSAVNNKPANSYVTPPSAPPLGGSFGGFYQDRKSVIAPKPQVPTYAPPSLSKPKKFNPPYPVGPPKGLHPVPHNTGSSGSSFTSSKHPQVSSASSPYNPYYNNGNTGSSPYNPYYNPGNSYSKTGIQLQNPSSGINTGFYGNQGHFPQQPSAPYLNPSSSGYHPNYQTGGNSFSQPGVIYVPSVVSPQRGTGDIFKEALVHSTVNAGVNAAANRIFYPSHFSGNHYSGYGSNSNGYGGGSTGSTTHIVHNNYYYDNNNNDHLHPSIDSQGTGNNAITHFDYQNNQNEKINSNNQNEKTNPNNQNNQNENNNSNNRNNKDESIPISSNYHNRHHYHHGNTASTSNNLNNSSNNNNQSQLNSFNNELSSNNSYRQLNITDDELRNLTEDLFSRGEFDKHNIESNIKLNLQKKVNSTNVTDESIEPLLTIQDEINQIPSIELIKVLYDNYEYDSQIKEKVTDEMLKEQNNFLEVILQTNVMSRLMKWLTKKNFIAPDMLTRKEILTRIWFTQIEGSTSAFERTFMAENYWNTTVMGLQNWIYFNYLEARKEIDYIGYMENLDLGNKGSLAKIVVKSKGIIQPTTIFIGTLPELEMALYTICYFARPNESCPVSLGGTKFHIFTHTFHSWGKDLLDVAVPVL